MGSMRFGEILRWILDNESIILHLLLEGRIISNGSLYINGLVCKCPEIKFRSRDRMLAPRDRILAPRGLMCHYFLAPGTVLGKEQGSSTSVLNERKMNVCKCLM